MMGGGGGVERTTGDLGRAGRSEANYEGGADDRGSGANDGWGVGRTTGGVGRTTRGWGGTGG